MPPVARSGAHSAPEQVLGLPCREFYAREARILLEGSSRIVLLLCYYPKPWASGGSFDGMGSGFGMASALL